MKWLLFVLAVGCSALRSSDPRFEPALQAVWQAFGQSSEAPEVEAVEGPALDCKSSRDQLGFTVPAPQGGTVCAAGAHYPGTRIIRLAWSGPGELADTALAHEAAHQLEQDLGLPDDYGHSSAPFQPGGAVESANAMLRKMGL
jgi:hypothetical protein